MAAQQGIQSGALDIQEKQRAAQMGKRPSLPPGYAWSEDGTRAVQIPGLEDVAKPLTEGQGKAAAFGLRSEEADKIINSIGRDGAVQPGMIKRMGEAVPFIRRRALDGAEFHANPEQQQIEQAQRNFINAVLRRESGAVISPEEFDNARKQYFPQPGDEPASIAQKCQPAANHRRIAHRGGAEAMSQAQTELAARQPVSELDRMPKASDHPGKYLTMPDGRVLQSVGGKWVMGATDAEIYPSDEPPQQSVPGRFVLSDAPPAADNRNLLEKAAQWASDTFGANGNLRGSAIGGVMQGMADPVAGLVQMGANLPGVKSLVGDSVNAGHRQKRWLNTKRHDRQQGAADLMLLASSETSRRRPNVIAAARVPMAATRRSGLLALLLARSAPRLTPEKDAQDFGPRSCRKGPSAGLLAPCWRLSLAL